MSSERFQRPQTAAGAHAAGPPDLAPHPPDVRDEEVAELLGAEFPVAMRGYERTAVDAYVQRVSRVLAELQAGRSPQSAVRYALEQVSEETRAILQQAHDTADAITHRSRSQAAERLEAAERESGELLDGAEREAAELRAEADRRVREAEDDVAAIWQERERLVEDAREIAGRLAEVADAAAERRPPLLFGSDDETEGAPAPAPRWDDDPDDGFAPPAAALRAVPPPPAEADTAPEPALSDAPPPPSEAPGPLAFELRDEAELGPMDEPAAQPAIDEAAVPVDDADTAERPL